MFEGREGLIEVAGLINEGLFSKKARYWVSLRSVSLLRIVNCLASR